LGKKKKSEISKVQMTKSKFQMNVKIQISKILAIGALDFTWILSFVI